jgi:hypothetical protein
VLGSSAVVSVQSGIVLVDTPDTSTHVTHWREIGNRQKLKFGSRFDTRRGSLTVRTARDKAGLQQTARFTGGVFTLTQRAADGATVELRLDQKLGACPKHATASAAAGKKKPKSRELVGSGKGKYKTRGQYATATVLGTRWITEDSCAGTRVKVLRGVVRVRSLVTGKIVNVTAGHSILVRRP